MSAAPKANPPIRTLLGPGPSPVNPRVLEALALPVVGHLDPKFLEIMDQSMAMLREVFQTKNRLALPMSGTGSAGMETCFVNLVEPGDAVLIGVNGVFGTRMVDVAQRCGAQVDTVEAEWGKALDAQKFKDALGKKKYKLAAVVHAETSTGVLQPALTRMLAEMLHRSIASIFILGLLLCGPARAVCPADCNDSGDVGIAELISAVRIALGETQPSTCLAADLNGSGSVSGSDGDQPYENRARRPDSARTRSSVSAYSGAGSMCDQL